MEKVKPEKGLNNPLLEINSIYPSLTKSEKKVADKVLNNPEDAVFYTITDLAEKSGVAEASVIRFCRKLGFRGYQEFKLSMAQNLSSKAEQMHGEIEESDSLETIASKLTAQNRKVIEDTAALLDVGSLQKAIDAMLEAKKIYFFGVGSSGITARDIKYRFMRLGFNVEADSDSHIIAMNAALSKEGAVVFAISTSGSTKDIVDAVRIAKDNGAFIICLTNHARSPVTQHADVVLLGTSRETPLQGGAFSSKLAQIHLLDVLSTSLALKYREKAYSAIEKTAKAVVDKLY